MSSDYLMGLRRELLKETFGTVLEIGFGTGLNLSCYPEQVKRIITVDPNMGMNRLVRKKIDQSKIPVDIHYLGGESLPFENNYFDSVVSSWTMCSIEALEQALNEVYRVLKPGSKFYFLEHGLSPEKSVQTWQNRLNPIQKICGDGCQLTVNIKEVIDHSPLEWEELKEFYMNSAPKFLGYTYQGIALKPKKTK